MKILFDVNMPRPLRNSFSGHEVLTAQSQGWTELKNGDLIAAAEKGGFDVLLTADKNLRYQQTLEGRKLAILILPTNKLKILKTIAPRILERLKSLKSGEFSEIDLDSQ